MDLHNGLLLAGSRLQTVYFLAPCAYDPIGVQHSGNEKREYNIRKENA